MENVLYVVQLRVLTSSYPVEFIILEYMADILDNCLCKWFIGPDKIWFDETWAIFNGVISIYPYLIFISFFSLIELFFY